MRPGLNQLIPAYRTSSYIPVLVYIIMYTIQGFRFLLGDKPAFDVKDVRMHLDIGLNR